MLRCFLAIFLITATTTSTFSSTEDAPYPIIPLPKAKNTVSRTVEIPVRESIDETRGFPERDEDDEDDKTNEITSRFPEFKKNRNLQPPCLFVLHPSRRNSKQLPIPPGQYYLLPFEVSKLPRIPTERISNVYGSFDKPRTISSLNVVPSSQPPLGIPAPFGMFDRSPVGAIDRQNPYLQLLLSHFGGYMGKFLHSNGYYSYAAANNIHNNLPFGSYKLERDL